MSTTEQVIRSYRINICDDCIALKGRQCHNPGCVFIRCTMDEVEALCDQLLIAPVVNGERFVLQEGADFQLLDEMLAALKAMVSMYDGLRDVIGESVKAKLTAADAAIAKAEAA